MTLQLCSLAERSSKSTSGEGEPVKAKGVIPLIHITFGFIQPYVRGLLNYTDYYTDMHASLTMFNSKTQQVCIFFKVHIQIYTLWNSTFFAHAVLCQHAALDL